MTSQTAPHAGRDKWWSIWLALLPALPLLSPLALLGLRDLARLSRAARTLLGIYAATQLLAALLAPQPLLALALAAARTVLMFGLIGLGARLGTSDKLRTLGAGLLGVYATALLGAANLIGSDVLSFRLSHPYYTPISLGLAGAFGVWIALAARSGRWWWRWPLGALGAAVLLLSGSRGPLLVAVLGGGLLLAARSGRSWWRWLAALGVVVALGLGLSLSGLAGSTVLSRVATLDTTGRDVVWGDTLSVLAAHPLGGVGSYLLGPDIASPAPSCSWFDVLEASGFSCPAALKLLNNAWIIAHNVFMQQAGETGVLGTLGLFLLLGAAAWRAQQLRDPLLLAIVFGLLLADLTDNVTLIPSPFFAETFWLAVGISLADLKRPDLAPAAWWGAGLLAVAAFPLWFNLGRPEPAPGVTLESLVAPTVWRLDERYAVGARLRVPPGSYRLQLRACRQSCVTIASTGAEQPQAGALDLWLFGYLPGAAPTRMQLRLLPGQTTPWNLRAIAQTSWTLKRVQP